MKKNLVILILLGISIYLCFRIYRDEKYSQEMNNLAIIDTIYLPLENYKAVESYPNRVSPKKVEIYRDQVNGKRDSYLLLPTIDPNPGPGTPKPITPDLLSDSISQILLKKDLLEITTKNTLDSTYKIRKFKIDMDQYDYNWLNNQLTSKESFKWDLVPYIKGSYRPFNRFTDLNLGITLETKRLNYNLGLNLFYYPSLQNALGQDIEISITYKFD